METSYIGYVLRYGGVAAVVVEHTPETVHVQLKTGSFTYFFPHTFDALVKQGKAWKPKNENILKIINNL